MIYLRKVVWVLNKCSGNKSVNISDVTFVLMVVQTYEHVS